MASFFKQQHLVEMISHSPTGLSLIKWLPYCPPHLTNGKERLNNLSQGHRVKNSECRTWWLPVLCSNHWIVLPLREVRSSQLCTATKVRIFGVCYEEVSRKDAIRKQTLVPGLIAGTQIASHCGIKLPGAKGLWDGGGLALECWTNYRMGSSGLVWRFELTKPYFNIP